MYPAEGAVSIEKFVLEITLNQDGSLRHAPAPRAGNPSVERHRLEKGLQQSHLDSRPDGAQQQIQDEAGRSFRTCSMSSAARPGPSI